MRHVCSGFICELKCERQQNCFICVCANCNLFSFIIQARNHTSVPSIVAGGALRDQTSWRDIYGSTQGLSHLNAKHVIGVSLVPIIWLCTWNVTNQNTNSDNPDLAVVFKAILLCSGQFASDVAVENIDKNQVLVRKQGTELWDEDNTSGKHVQEWISSVLECW